MEQFSIGNPRVCEGTDGCLSRRSAAYQFWLAFLSLLDITLTYFILWHFAHMGGREVNGVADLVIQRFGLPGMILYKLVLVGFAAEICEWVGQRQPATARRLASVLVAISGIPVAAAAAQLAIVAMRE